jgi:NAD+ diphosphatase
MTFTGSPLDRVSQLRHDAAWLAARLADPASRFLAMAELKALVHPGASPAIAWQPGAAVAAAQIAGATCVFLGMAEGRAHFAIDVAPAFAAGGAEKFIDVRTLAPQVSAGDAAILAQARTLVDWHARHRHCAACGGLTLPANGGYSRRCGGCAAEHFPRTDPVVIMWVVDGDRCLLGRQRQFAPGMYSALAGFVEAGESIEEAVRREVREEAGVIVGDVAYVASQPWPFPASLMIGCQAEAASRDITRDGDELEDAAWFDRAAIAAMLTASRDPNANPRLPPPFSLAHQLARRWLDGA